MFSERADCVFDATIDSLVLLPVDVVNDRHIRQLTNNSSEWVEQPPRKELDSHGLIVPIAKLNDSSHEISHDNNDEHLLQSFLLVLESLIQPRFLINHPH